MKKRTLLYGLISGGIVVSMNLVFWFTLDLENPDWDFGEIIGYSSMIISQLIIAVAIWDYRERQNQGNITFKKAFLIGLTISVIASGLFTAFDTLYVTVINPDFMEQFMEHSKTKMQESGLSAEEIDEQLTQFEAFQGPTGVLVNALVMFLTVLLIGLLITVISGLILSRSDSTNKKPIEAAKV